MKAQLWVMVALLAVPLPNAGAFTNTPVTVSAYRSPLDASSARACSTDGTSADSHGDVVSVDVSDLGVTVADLEQRLPRGDFSFAASGCESTSRLPGVDDQGCDWAEGPEDLDVTLRIPGLVRQPAAALAVLFSTTTVSVSAFGRVVWSCVQRGVSEADACTFLAAEGEDGVPVITLRVRKRDAEERWGGLILQIGEDSLL